MQHLTGGVVEYRLERRGDAAVVIMHGGHLRAGLTLDEDVFADAGLTVLAPSRPGYGRTPLSTGTTAAGFADVTADVCRHLGIDRVAAVVGISAGGPTAMALAARHPDLVERLILQSAQAPLTWPGRGTRLLAGLIFSPATERLTWGGVRGLLRRSPDVGLRMLLRDLSTVPARRAVAQLRPEHRAMLISLLCQMRSGEGFRNDLRRGVDVTAEIGQPTLVLASRRDGSVPFGHAEYLAGTIRRAELVESRSDSHFLEFGEDWPAVCDTIRAFLTAARPGDAAGPGDAAERG
ncbi:Pimeloyl-ACP methyl ester carboxylesterase [Micromonospora phaseoli]|uniref:Pimeloyl-ACP methyl ester carboxylesterase n=1 Tax=Micromonospora phaseoli TaxID=1144548 RepID=A0A1H6UL82_9ACTN|nr:pimeloyl-ACP methyl ester carboxylesterase [Micromonospora phaseoli]SEI88970.1 Pimeloyl-ACP methyl ester carboxylesterase [Micromonospora phaseoli]